MTKSNLTKLAGLLVVALIALVAVPVQAQDGQPDPVTPADITHDQVNAIASGLYCPVCENIPLDACGTQACADWRQEIRDMLAAGESEAAIREYFVDRYGRRVLATPEPVGIDLLLWIAPIVGVLVGAGVLIVTLRRMAPGALTETIAPNADVRYRDLDPGYVARAQREFEEFIAGTS
ncbi:MAG: cytochrome c-type biogenesis protein CcmH [Chloroflexi bacterium]|nr:cytochrome c-type biogenesis protein CcmH [Chloroflexota bacterium]